MHFLLVATVEMKPKLFYTLAVCLLILGEVSSHDVADVYPSWRNSDVPSSQRGSGVLQQAIKYLVNYTASEAKASLNMHNIGSTVAAIAYQELTEKLSKCTQNVLCTYVYILLAD